MSLSEIKSTMSEITPIESIVNPGNAVETTEVRSNNPVLTSVFEGNQVLTTHNTVPQVETIIQTDKTYLTNVIYGNWEVVWSVNGQTGDVVIDMLVTDFRPNTTYQKDAAIVYNGDIYRAIDNITTGDEFDDTQWEKIVRGVYVEPPYTSLERIASYLYKISFDTIPEYIPAPLPNAGCSSYVYNGKLHRNFDWLYDESPTFIVQCKGFKGIAVNNTLTDTELNDEALGQLPYRVVDGVNENGIMMSTHVVTNDWGWHGSGTKTIPLPKLPYLILTSVKSMETIETDLADILPNLATSPTLDAMGYIAQYVVTDGTTTCIVTPPTTSTGDYTVVDATENPKLTNFRWVENETVTRSADYMQDHPVGVERWNAMTSDFSKLRYTKAYETPEWLSEFIGERDTDKYSTDEELEEIFDVAHAKYLIRTRNGELWQTMHSVVYSPTGMEELYIQEDWTRNYAAAGGAGVGGFIAEYGVTPYQDIVDAILAGESVFVHDPNGGTDEHGIYVPFTMYRANGMIFFGGVVSNGNYCCYKVNAAGWSTVASLEPFLVASAQVLTEEQKAIARNNIGANAELPGGTTNQVLMKASNVDYDTKWGDANSAEWGNITGAITDQTDLQEELDDKVDKITGKGLSTNDYTNADKQIIEKTDSITPAQASSSNQLADKAFVNSSVQTATANFRGNWSSWGEVPIDDSLYPVDYAGSHTPTVNDYLVVQDASGYTVSTLEGTWRFKYSGVWDIDGKDGWHPEYQVNGTPMTAVQLAAINSGITQAGVTKLNGIASGAEVNVQSDWNQTDQSSDDYIKNKPSVNDATLTIKQNGTTVTTFSANASTNVIANITAPNIQVTSVDPGSGSPLANNNFVAVYGSEPKVDTYDIKNKAVTEDKIDWESVIERIYPIGSIYSNTAISSAETIGNILGGTWESWGEGGTSYTYRRIS